jgi:hypothetical protein
VLLLALKLTLAPGLVAATTLAGRRWGQQVAGWLGGLPVVVGPILLVLALEQGEGFAAEAAEGSIYGLLSLSGFVLAYAWSARHVGWPLALLAGWAAFALATIPLESFEPPVAVGLALVCASFLITARALPRSPGDRVSPVTPPRFDLAIRAACTAALVLVLSALAEVMGARLSGMLAAFPVLASVLAAFTHAQSGAAAAADFLRGLVWGLLSFALFCFVVAVLLPDTSIALAFLAGTAAALTSHVAGYALDTSSRLRTEPGRNLS